MYPKLHHVHRVSLDDSNIWSSCWYSKNFLSLDTSSLLWLVPSTIIFPHFTNDWLVYCTWGVVYYQLWCNKVVIMHFPCWVKNELIWNTTFGKLHNCPICNKITILLSVQYTFFKPLCIIGSPQKLI